MTIEEKNFIIGKYMGIEYTFHNFYPPPNYWMARGKLIDKLFESNVITVLPSSSKSKEQVELPFHISWDWLIPVVEKVESEGYEVSIIDDECEICTMGYVQKAIVTEQGTTKMDAVYNAMFNFIQLDYKEEN